MNKGVLVVVLVGVWISLASAQLSINCASGEGRCDKRLRVVKAENNDIALTCQFGVIRIRNSFFGR